MHNKFWQSPLVVPALLVVATAVFFAPLWLDGRQLAGSDFQQIHYPLLNFVVDNIHATGEIPLWNPHQFLGYSVVGNPQYGLLYPPNWLLLAFPGKAIYNGVGLLMALHFFWLACGGFVLARHCQASRVGALLAALIIAFSSFTASKLYAGHYAVLLTLSWSPWVLVAVSWALQRPRWWNALPGAVALGLAILAGHPQFVYIISYGVVGVVVYQVVQASSTATRLRQLRQAALIGGVSLVLGAAVLLPVYDYQSQTVRGQAANTLDFANQHAIPPQQLGSLAIADLFGTPTTATGYWGEPFYEEMTAYIGLLPLVLLYFAARLQPSGWLLWGGLALFGGWMSLGELGGLYAVQYYLVPPARGFRAPGRFLLLTTIGLAMLTALTITRLQATPTLDRATLLRRVFLPALLVTAGGALAFTLFGGTLQDDPAQAVHISEQLATSAGFLALLALAFWFWNHQQQLAVGLLVVVAAANLWWAAAPLRNTDSVMLSPVWVQADALSLNPEPHRYGRIIQTGTPPGIINGASWIDAYSPQGYDPIAPAGWFELVEATGQFILEPASATNRLFNVRYAVAGQPLENYGFVAAQFFEPVQLTETLYFYENPQPLPRVYLAPAYAIEPDDEIVRQRIQRGEVDRGDLVLVPAEPACAVDVRATTATDNTATITQYRANTVEVRVATSAPAILVLSDQYDPDWRVAVNDEPADMLRINTTFRGVCVPAGEHVVRFSYQPVWFWRGVGLAGLGWAVVLSIAMLKAAQSLKLLTRLNLFSLSRHLW